MKKIQTSSFQKLADLNRQPTFSPEPDAGGQTSLFERDQDDVDSILRRWKKNKTVPTKKIYQLGVDFPAVERQDSSGSL